MEVLAQAFRDNPLNVAVIGSDPARRLRCNRAGMRQLLPVARRHGLVLGARGGGDPGMELSTTRGTGLAGALVAAPPYTHPLPAPPLSAQLHALWVQGFGVRSRWTRVFAHLERIHPIEPHWYLATLGVVPDARSRGVGSSLLRCLLGRADRDALPCYLETDRAENLAFYEAAGFAVERESRILGVRVWHMWREAAASGRPVRPGAAPV